MFKQIGILSVLFLMSCKLYAQQFILDTFQTKLIRLEPALARGTDLSAISESTEYIPLETTKQSYFGKIDRLEVVGNVFFIYDRETDAILIFSETGRFVSKINKIPGVKPMEKSNVFGNFCIDKKSKRIIITLMTTSIERIVSFFDFKGGFIETITLEKNNPFSKFSAFMSFGNRNYIFFNSHSGSLKWKDPDFFYDLIWYKEPGVFYNTLLPYHFTKDIFGYDYFSSEKNFYVINDTSAFYVKPFHYDIYKVGPHSADMAFRFIFPHSVTLPQLFFTDSALNNKRENYLRKNRQYIYMIRDFYQLNNNLVFKLVTANPSSFGKGSQFLYNLESNELIGLFNITPDRLNYYLPLFTENNNVQAAENRSLYASFSSYYFIEATKEINKSRKQVYPLHLRDFFKKATSENNPVILKVTLKKNVS